MKPLPPIPEPSTMLLFGSGILGVIGYARRRQNTEDAMEYALFIPGALIGGVLLLLHAISSGPSMPLARRCSQQMIQRFRRIAD